MPSNFEKKIDKTFDYMTFEEKAVYVFNLNLNQQSRNQAVTIESRMPIEQQLKMAQKRSSLSNYLSDRTIHNLYLEIAEETDRRTVDLIRGIFGLKEDGYCDLPILLFEIGLCNNKRFSALLSASAYRSHLEKDKQGLDYYIESLDLPKQRENIQAVIKLSEEEVETVRDITSPEFISELEKNNFPEAAIKVLWDRLFKIEELASRRESFAYNELLKQFSGDELELQIKELNKQMKRFGHYDII